MMRIPFALLLLATPLVAQPPVARLHGETEAAQTRKRLVEAQQKLAAGQTADAVDDLLRVLNDSADDLVPLPDGTHPPARRLVQRALAGLPPDALKALRDRIDEPARKLYEAGRTARDPKPLRTVVDRYFASRSAEPALRLLGELAFERGEFDDAERFWRALLPGAADALPQPATDPTSAWAKAILAAAFAGDVKRAADELPAFREKHPTATGRLAGTDGLFADTLAKLIAAPPRIPTTDGWTTLGGGSSRDGRAAGLFPFRDPNRPKWKTPIPRDKADHDQPRPAGAPAAKTLAFHPAVMSGQAYVADAGRVFAFDLRTGAARLAFDARSLVNGPAFAPSELALPTPFDADFALTAADDKLYARLGNPGEPTPRRDENDKDKKHASFLLELTPTNHPNPPANVLTLKPTWTVPPPVKAGIPAAWEGAPLVLDGVVLAAFTRLEDSRRMLAVAAFRPPATKPLWVAEACDADANQTDGFPHRHELLTLAAGNAVYATHTGLTVAFDILTGRRAWAFRNPPAAQPPAGGSPRDLSPAVAHGGRVFLAPADGDRVYALDADTGAKLWESAAAVQVEYLMGVSRGRLIAAIHGPQKGLRGYAVIDGRDQPPTGWRNHEDAQLPHLGRGILSDDVILWPTGGTNGLLYQIDPTDGMVLPVLPKPGPHGNLAFADGVLLVATATEVWGYFLDAKPLPAPLTRPLTKVEPTPFRSLELAAPPRVFDPLAAPALAADAREKVVALPVAAWPLRAFDGRSEWPGWDAAALLAERRYFACDGRHLFAVRPADGKILWETALGAEAFFARGLLTTDGKLIAFASAEVGGFDAKTGAAKWRFEWAGTPITTAALAGNRLVLLLGEHALVALDIDTGKPAWCLDSQLRPRLTAFAVESAPRFAPHLFSTSRTAFALRTDGTRVRIDADTGAAVGTANPFISSWGGPPTADGGVTFFPDGPLRVIARHDRVGPTDWARDFPGETSATGRAPAVRVIEGALLAAVFRNYGTELHRLDPRTGKPLWANPAILLTDDVNLHAIETDRERLFVLSGNQLLALDMRTGRELWAKELPSDGWRVRVGRAGVIAFAPSPEAEEPLGVVAKRLAGRFAERPDLWSGQAITFLSAAWDRTQAVRLLDADNGRELQRWSVPTAGPLSAVHLAGDVAAVASSGRVVLLTRPGRE